MQNQRFLEKCFLVFRKVVERNSTWSVDRFGRLLAGLGTLCFVILSIFSSKYFLIPVMLINLNLVITSFSDKCVLRDFLKSLGAKEREKIYHENGSLRAEEDNYKSANNLTEGV